MELKDLVNSPDTVLIDVRESIERMFSKVKSARHMPMSQIDNYVDEIRQWQGPKVIFCRSGRRSGMVIKLLAARGITDLHNGVGVGDVKMILSH